MSRFKKTTLKSFGGRGKGIFKKRSGGLPIGKRPTAYRYNPETRKFEETGPIETSGTVILERKFKVPEGWKSKRKVVEERLDRKTSLYKSGQKDFYTIEK